jgi:predicted transcriptional regulator
MEVTRDLGIDDHTKVNFHLKVLKEEGLISQDDQKYYSLSPKGVKVTQCMNIVIDNMAH